MKKIIGLLLITSLLGPLTACNRKIIYSKDRAMEPISKLFNTSLDEAYKTSKEAILRLGYRIDREDEPQKSFRTVWLSTKADSHYVDLFDRRDYGTVGAYYRLQVKVTEKQGQADVEIEAPVRSIIGRMKSSHIEEKKVLKKMADLLRKEDFEMTNVGVEE